MSTTKAASTDDFYTREITTRGKTYHLRELTGETYDRLVDLSTDKSDDSVNSVMLLRLMTAESLVDPKMTVEELGKLPLKARNVLFDACNDLNFNPEAGEGSPAPNSAGS